MRVPDCVPLVCAGGEMTKEDLDDLLYNLIYWSRFIVAIVLVLLLVGVFV